MRVLVLSLIGFVSLGCGARDDASAEGGDGATGTSQSGSGPSSGVDDGEVDDGEADDWSEDECCDGQHWDECEAGSQSGDAECADDQICLGGFCADYPACYWIQLGSECGNSMLESWEECEGVDECENCRTSAPSAFDLDLQQDVVWDLVVEPGGTYYTVGFNGDTDMGFVQRSMFDGTPLWRREASYDERRVTSLAVDQMGRLIAVGQDAISSETLLVTYSQDGDPGWTGLPVPGSFADVEVMSDGRVVAVGWDSQGPGPLLEVYAAGMRELQVGPGNANIFSAVTWDDQSFYVAGRGADRIVTQRVLLDGTLDWSNEYIAEGQGGESVAGIEIDAGRGEVIVAGESDGGVLLVAYTLAGEPAWEMPCFAGTVGSARSFTLMSSGRYLIGGEIGVFDDVRPWAFVTDPTGQLEWSRIYAVGEMEGGGWVGSTAWADNTIWLTSQNQKGWLERHVP